MSVITREILKNYITCPDPATRNKFYNLLDSFWHKVEGKIIKSVNKDAGGNTTGFTVVDQDGATEIINLPVLPNSQPISFITGLAEALAGKVTSVAGKGLSTKDFTLELYNKLTNLENYVPPEFWQIADIEGLIDALNSKQDAAPEGYGFSQQNFTLSEKKNWRITI